MVIGAGVGVLHSDRFARMVVVSEPYTATVFLPRRCLVGSVSMSASTVILDGDGWRASATTVIPGGLWLVRYCAQRPLTWGGDWLEGYAKRVFSGGR